MYGARVYSSCVVLLTFCTCCSSLCRKDELNEKIRQFQKDTPPCTIQVVTYGYSSSDFEIELLMPEYLEDWLEENAATEQPPSELALKRKWFDIRGYHLDTMLMLGLEFDMHEETIKDAGILQRDKIEASL
eukprot:m.386744 g.386744  ORF g.386744 m.386744 type:complete len:131 (+) comp20057_c1_seq2:122-514(+)